MTGAELIAAERQRQIEQEGWTAQHDDNHEFYELWHFSRPPDWSKTKDFA